jgi:hypothetical protein
MLATKPCARFLALSVAHLWGEIARTSLASFSMFIANVWLRYAERVQFWIVWQSGLSGSRARTQLAPVAKNNTRIVRGGIAAAME